jgi:hypothetical protein
MNLFHLISYPHFEYPQLWHFKHPSSRTKFGLEQLGHFSPFISTACESLKSGVSLEFSGAAPSSVG